MSDQPSVRHSAPEEIFETPKLSVDRLPQLRGVFERTSANAIEKLKSLITAPVAGYLNQIEVGDSWDLLDNRENCIAAMYYVSEWDTQILVLLERRLLFAAVDAAYGSDGSETPEDLAEHLTTLDLAIAKELFECAASGLREAFTPLSEITISFERIVTEVEFNLLGPQSVPSLFGQILFQILEGGGRMFILVPQAPLMPLRKRLERTTLKEAQVDDPRWSQLLQTRVSTTPVRLLAIADGPVHSLDQVSRFHIGQVIPMDSLTSPDIVIKSGSEALFKCSLGQIEGHLSLKIDRPVEGPKGLAENVLAEAYRSSKSAATQ